jgi:AcrR family transcriptional regulator
MMNMSVDLIHPAASRIVPDIGAKFLHVPGARRPRVFSARNARPRIMDTAKRLLSPGAPVPTIQQIAEQSGLSRRALYNHFRNLDDVRLALMQQAVSELSRSRYPEIRRGQPPQIAIPRFVEDSAVLMRSQTYGWIIHLATGLPPVGVEPGRGFLAAARGPLIMTLENFLLYCRIAGACPQCDPGAASERLIRTVEAICTAPMLLEQDEDEGPMVREIASMFLALHFGPPTEPRPMAKSDQP